MRLCRRQRASSELRPITSRGHQLLHRERRFHYPREALGMHYADFDVILPTPSPKTYTSTTSGPTVSESKMAFSPAQALEAFNRLSDQEKTKVLAYLCAGHPHKALQVTEGKELPRWTMAAILWLLIFTSCWFLWWVASASSTH